MKEAHLETIHLIALTIHPQHLNSDYKFENRYECFSYIKVNLLLLPLFILIYKILAICSK